MFQNKETRYRGAKPFNYVLDIVTKPLFLKRGFAENRIITDWSLIVGKTIAEYSTPRKLSFQKDKKNNGTLYIEVNNSSFATEIEYLRPVIVEKIATYFGYKAVSSIKIQQNPTNQIKLQQNKSTNKEILPEDSDALELILADIHDENLKATLRSLGKQVLAK